MRYTNYFSGLVKEKGVPNLPVPSFQKFMNIIHLEGKLEGLKKANEKDVKANGSRTYQLEIFEVERKITELTRDVPAAEFLRQLTEAE